MSKPVADYGLANCCPSEAVKAFMAELVAKIDAEVDFSRVDAVYAFGPEASGPYLQLLLFRRWPGEGIVADGKELRNGMVGNGNFRSVDTANLLSYFIVHETGHMLGLPDLYGRACATCPDTHEWAGVWDTMDSVPPTAHFLAWHKWLLGWLTPDEIREVPAARPSSVEGWLTPTEYPGGTKLIVVRTSTSKLYAVEARLRWGEDDDLCDDGVLVYSVDSAVMNGQGPIRIKPARPGGGCGPLSGAAFGLDVGDVAVYEDAVLRVELLETNGSAYRLRVTRK